MENRVNIIELDESKALIDQVAERIEESFKIFKGADLLIINRRLKGDFIEVMAESLYEYKKGVILLERFFRKNSCKPKGVEVEQISHDDKNLIRKFTEFSTSMPSAATLTEEEMKEYTDKLNDFTEKISNIRPEKTILKTYRYKNLMLDEFDSVEDDVLKIMSNMYAGMGLNFLAATTWASLQNTSIALTTIEHKDYIDLVIIPITQKDEK